MHLRIVIVFSFLLALIVLPPVASAGAAVPPVSRIGEGGDVHDMNVDGGLERYIVELAAPPAARVGASAAAAQAATVRSQLATLREDLERIAGGTRHASEAGTAAKSGWHLGHEYVLTFAGASIAIPPEAAAAVRALPYVAKLHPDLPVHAYSEPGIYKVRAREVWTDLGNRGEGTVVSIIDTGIDYTHPAFGNGFGPGHRVMGGWDFVNDDGDPMDDHGHGTHVAGIVGADSPELTGVAPAVRFLAYKVLGATGSGSTSNIIAAIERSADPNGDGDTSDRADVANLSLGGSGGPDDPSSRAVDGATALGVVVVVAAGNAGRFHSIGSPGAARSAITVGASDVNDFITSFSSRGPNSKTLAIKPEVVAPGAAIRSAYPGGRYTSLNGTSMAAPHVAGAAALVRSLHPEWSPERVKSAIVNSSAQIGSEVMARGGGRLDAFSAAESTSWISPAHISFGRAALEPGEWKAEQAFSVVNGGSAAKEYTIAPGSLPTGVSLTFEPATLRLEPGSSLPVVARLSVTNASVPMNETGSRAYSGTAMVTSGSETLHLPWAFVKGTMLTIRYTGSGFARASAGNATTGFAQIGSWGDQQTFEVFLPPATYDVAVAGLRPQETRLVVRENVAVSGYVLLEVDGSDAVHPVDYSVTTPGGETLTPSASRFCDMNRTLVFPAGSPAGSLSLNPYGTAALRSVPVSERFALTGYSYCVEPARLWAIQHPLLRGVAPGASAAVPASKLHKAAIELRGGSLPAQRSLLLAGGNIDPARPGGFAPAHMIGVVSVLSRWEGEAFFAFADGDERPPYAAIALTDGNSAVATAPFRLSGGRLATFTSATPPPTFWPTTAGTMKFGDGPHYPALSFSGSIPSLDVAAPILGSFEEERSPGATYVLSDAGGAVVRSGSLPAKFSGLDRKPYILKIDAPQVAAGVDGSVTLTTRFDLRSSDVAPPRVTSMMIEDSTGRQAVQLRPAEAAKLRFSAVDQTLAMIGIAYAPLRESGTRAWWRLSGSGAWQALALNRTGEEMGSEAALGHPPRGSIYTADLRAATSAGIGTIDLKIEYEDNAGNASELVVAPAFSIAAPATRGRAVRRP
jgi:hypothetical protein